MAQATHDRSQVAPAFEQTLEDGKLVRLVALGRPSKWPFCWWDAEGNPVDSRYGLYFTGEPPEGLWAVVETTVTPEELKRQTPIGSQWIRDAIACCDAIPSESGRLEVGVLVGPWKELARPQLGQPLTIGGVTYCIESPNAYAERSFAIHVWRTGVLEHEDCLTTVGQDGTEVEPMHIPPISYRRDTASRTLEQSLSFHGLPLEKVAYYRLHQRKRQWVTFSGYATEPKLAPKTVVTRAEVIAAEQEQKRRKEQVELEAWRAKRKGWAETPPDPATERGLLRMLVDAARRGDENAVRELLVVTKPEAAEARDAIAHLIVAAESSRSKAVERFGEMVVEQQLESQGLTRDLESDLMGDGWTRMPDGTMSNGGLVPRKNTQGHFRLDIDNIAKEERAAQQARQMAAQLERLERLLVENKSITVEELKTAMRQSPATTQAVP